MSFQNGGTSCTQKGLTPDGKFVCEKLIWGGDGEAEKSKSTQI